MDSFRFFEWPNRAWLGVLTLHLRRRKVEDSDGHIDVRFRPLDRSNWPTIEIAVAARSRENRE